MLISVCATTNQTSNNDSDTQSPHPVVLRTRQGMAMDLTGVAGLSAYTVPISTFIKIKRPHIEKMNQNCEKICDKTDILNLAFAKCVRYKVGVNGTKLETLQQGSTIECLQRCLDNADCNAVIYVPYYKTCVLKAQFEEHSEERQYTVYDFNTTCVRRETTFCKAHSIEHASNLSQIISINLEARITQF